MSEFEISFWEELLCEVHTKGTMDMHEAHKRENLYHWCLAANWTEAAARAKAEDCPADELPPVIFIRDSDEAGCAIYNDYCARAHRQELHPMEAARQYFDAVRGQGHELER